MWLPHSTHCVLRAKLAAHDPQSDPDMLRQDLLRKYLTYAKQHCRPQLQQADYDKIQRVGASQGVGVSYVKQQAVAMRRSSG
eukprot:1161112-Pelagomonas_calceolata.AAC.11